jgi:hypothetical protein
VGVHARAARRRRGRERRAAAGVRAAHRRCDRPAAAEYVTRSLQRAAREHAQLVVLQIDTPGGLDTSMRSIVKDIIASPVPVAGFVAPARCPGGERRGPTSCMPHTSRRWRPPPIWAQQRRSPSACRMCGRDSGSAGARRRAGARQPDSGHDVSAAKRVNDAIAYIRSLAQLRGRDVAWAEQAGARVGQPECERRPRAQGHRSDRRRRPRPAAPARRPRAFAWRLPGPAA